MSGQLVLYLPSLSLPTSLEDKKATQKSKIVIRNCLDRVLPDFFIGELTNHFGARQLYTADTRPFKFSRSLELAAKAIF